MLSRIAASYEADPARCQDLLQEISVALWKALPRWRGEASVRTFCARVAHNCSIDHLARNRARYEDALDDEWVDPAPDPARAAETSQRRRNLIEAIAGLPLGQRQVVVLSLEGFSQRETGQALGVDENTVAQRLSRARRQLREWLGER
ncbi:RNA polymerase sigma factor [Lysobacter korlensis]|uniref:RNA polymerase sigma factor n=1 Tax=Lysobacter korlensis TaxID=553636 RepID=A0ABV6RH14_9GAMM